MSRVRTMLVVPCYNEEARLDVEAFRNCMERSLDIGFLFVDDGSTDGTAEVLRRLCQGAEARFAYLVLPTNMGKGEAVRRGVLAALETPCDYVGFWDADLATPLEAIPAFCELLDERPDLEVVIGARVQLLGRRIERNPARHYLGRVFATVVSLVLGLRVYDTQCGAKLFRVSEETRALFREPFHSRWIFDVEILARMIRARRGTGLRRVDQVVYEVPLVEWRDIAGSRLRLRDFLRTVPEIAVIYWKVLRRSSAGAPDGAALVARSGEPSQVASTNDPRGLESVQLGGRRQDS